VKPCCALIYEVYVVGRRSAASSVSECE
jgi:hypothetical protein